MLTALSLGKLNHFGRFSFSFLRFCRAVVKRYLDARVTFFELAAIIYDVLVVFSGDFVTASIVAHQLLTEVLVKSTYRVHFDHVGIQLALT